MNNVTPLRPVLFDRPFALSIGPQRCGAVWLDRYLRSRGDICLPYDVKEIFYFDRHFQRGPEFYISHFDVESHHKLVCELSTTAFDHPQAPERVFDLCGPDIHLLCPLRDPVQRSLAVYRDFLGYGIVHGTVEEAVETAPQILFASRYADHLQRWIQKFGRGKIHVLFYEDLVHSPAAYARNLCEILALPYIKPDKKIAVEAGVSDTWLSKAGEWLGRFSTDRPAIEARQQENYNWLRTRLSAEIGKLEEVLESPIAR